MMDVNDDLGTWVKSVHEGASMTPDELREICVLTLELTRIRQNECKHLMVENFAPELFRKLIDAWSNAE